MEIRTSKLIILLLLLSQFLFGQELSVVANNVDLLNTGISFNKVGNFRDSVFTGVQFDVDYDANIDATSYLWDFGDGNTSTDKAPFHVYKGSSNFIVQLKVFDASQVVCFAFQTVIFTMDTPVDCEFLINHTTIGTILNDFELSDISADFVNFYYDFGDGQIDSTLNGEIIHNYDEIGLYEVCVTGVKSDGSSCKECILIDVGSVVESDTCNTKIAKAEEIPGIFWTAQKLTNPWENDFSNEINYGFSDANGDGRINELDAEAIEINYGKTHGIIIPDEFVEGIEGIDPPLELDISQIDPSELEHNSTLEIPIVLGTEEQPIENFYGIAFTIIYDTTVVKSGSANVDFILNSWVNPFNEALISIEQDQYESGKIEVALSRTNQEYITGYGEIGKLNVVIEDNLGGFKLVDSTIILETGNIKLIDDLENVIPLSKDSVAIQLDQTTGANYLSERMKRIQVFPNPVQSTLQINSPDIIVRSIIFIDPLGRLVDEHINLDTYQYRIDSAGLPNGIYLLRIQCDEGILTKKIIIKNR